MYDNLDEIGEFLIKHNLPKLTEEEMEKFQWSQLNKVIESIIKFLPQRKLKTQIDKLENFSNIEGRNNNYLIQMLL